MLRNFKLTKESLEICLFTANFNRMKSYQILLIVFLSIGVSLQGCKKEDNQPSDNNNNDSNAPTENVIQVEINGYAKTFKDKFSSSSDGNKLTIKAWGTANETFTIQINSFGKGVKKGTYQMNFSSDFSTNIFWNNGNMWSCPENINGSPKDVATGTFEITYYDGHKIAGKFSGTLGSIDSKNTHKVTNGTFSAINL